MRLTQRNQARHGKPPAVSRVVGAERQMCCERRGRKSEKRLKVVAENSSLDHIQCTSRILPKFIKKSSKEGIGQVIPLNSPLANQVSWPIVVAPMRLQAVHLHPFLLPTQSPHHRSDQLANAPHPRLVKSSYRPVLCHLPLDQPTSNSTLPPILPEPPS
jgi:hypothetical protein